MCYYSLKLDYRLLINIHGFTFLNIIINKDPSLLDDAAGRNPEAGPPLATRNLQQRTASSDHKSEV